MTDLVWVMKPAALCGWLCFGLMVGWLPQASADEVDHDEALELAEQGVILPLQSLIGDALGRYPGRFLEAELEYDDGRYIYELEIVTRDRRVLDLEYDAVSGKLLDVDEDD
ncbi:PepSY domain-containing protein [Halopseudomonas litoralis]